MDIYDPFMTWVDHDPDMSRSDRRRAVEQYLVRDDLIRAYLEGQAHLDEVGDCLAEQGLDPLDWGETAIAGVQAIITDGGKVYTNETGLFLPRGINAQQR